MKTKIDGKHIYIPKNCGVCVHYKVCAFRNQIKEVATSNFMYTMNEYANGNNIMYIFDANVNCKHYVLGIPLGKITHETHSGLIYNVVWDVFKLHSDLKGIGYNNRDGIVTYSSDDDIRTVHVDDMFSDFTVVE